MLLITNIFECFTGPERQVSKTRRIRYCQKFKPLLYLLPQLLGKPHNILVMGRAAFMRVPVSEANDLNYLLEVWFADWFILAFLSCSYICKYF
jgi:hypothetical protein